MCARYREIPDVKFRRGLGFGPIVNWFVPAPVLLALMLPGWVWGFLVSTFVEGMDWLIRCNRVRLGAKNKQFLLTGKSGCINLKPKVARQFPFVKTP